MLEGAPALLGSDDVMEFATRAIGTYLANVKDATLSREPGSPWGNVYVKSFNGNLRDEPIDREIFCTLREAKVLTALYR